ncbi:hypothetical protein CROQUDRAFT_652863 [Cronartium quercuum f. sp. fusiforme G11]|uniref:Uncharacterized protein n=1 Tax=Cronartium quercuum f. sp. fusiforme G11 TaxID=708437 RepID=A0A9P6NQG1_9BASI|nr:hypothetical protein CROQUDRAFT_652863 [Cronartium quercuum f. sp. fusiforme G11]
MQSILILLLTVLGAVLADQPVINTPPSVAQCLPSQVSFNGGVPPYYISVIPGGQPTAAALEDFPMQATSPYTWIVKQPAGTSVTLQIRDSNGQINYSQQVTVQPGQSNCLGNSASSGSSNSSATTPTTNTTSPASETPTTDNATATASNATSTTTPSTTNTSSPTTATKGSSPFTTTPSTSNSSSTVSGTSNPAAGAARNSAASSKFNAALIATVVVGTTFALSA